ncbi:NUDIX domain-containing protein [Alkalihalobacillus sp. R86527]|uniref:NUDIX hydrolase n=1 Tax=Alkalihalobacillus sp. R86527 TaxID=3093863 RepID=UPI00366EC554
MSKRGNVWLGAAGIVEEGGSYLVVKKNYGGLKGQWSFPAGFVDQGETVDEAAKREVFEETGIIAEPTKIAGIRSGVIKSEISDNLVVFYMKMTGGEVKAEEGEIAEACFLSKQELLRDPNTSSMIPYFLNNKEDFKTEMNPGSQFGYTTYKLFHNK